MEDKYCLKEDKYCITKENTNFLIGISVFITALIFLVWLGSTAFYF
ncbi:MAG: hypothetical protein ACW98X_17895 [Promethearchaeota archaeon]|jgi:hypothetical protein